MDLQEPVYESDMRPFEIGVLVYELPVLIAALLAGSGMGFFYALIVIRYGPSMSPLIPTFLMAGMVAAGLIFIFWGASYYCKGVMVFSDRVRFVMALGHRDVLVSQIESVEALTLEQTRRTLLGLAHANLTPSVQGAVMLARKSGRPWVFSPEDSDEFIACVNKVMADPEKQESKED